MIKDFTRKILVYIPSYKCEHTIVKVLEEIPGYFWDHAEIMVLDNCSPDGTVQKVLEANSNRKFPRVVHVVQPSSNVGYSGSQKLAYRIALESPTIEWVVMMHGDGQYPPAALEGYVPYLETAHGHDLPPEHPGVVYGYRSKRAQPGKDETPWMAYLIIKVLSFFESLITGIWRKEWHTGFIMYHRSFLKKLNLVGLTTTMHIDGHLLFAAGVLKEKTVGTPIYKRYKEYEKFSGWGRVKYVFQVMALMFSFNFHKKDLRISEATAEANKLRKGEYECRA